MNAFYLKKCVFRVEAKKQAVGDLQAQNHELKTCAKRILLKLPTLNVDANLKEEIVQKFNVRNVDVIAVAICEKKMTGGYLKKTCAYYYSVLSFSFSLSLLSFTQL